VAGTWGNLFGGGMRMMRDNIVYKILIWVAKKMDTAILRGFSGLDLSDEELAAAAALQNAIDNNASAYPRREGGGFGG